MNIVKTELHNFKAIKIIKIYATHLNFKLVMVLIYIEMTTRNIANILT